MYWLIIFILITVAVAYFAYHSIHQQETTVNDQDLQIEKYKKILEEIQQQKEKQQNDLDMLDADLSQFVEQSFDVKILTC